MFFGLTNSPATFQTMMDDIFEDLITEGVVVVYLDDIPIFTKTLEEHREVVCRVLDLQIPPPLLETREVWIWEDVNWILWSGHLSRLCIDGPSQSRRSVRVANSNNQERSPVILRLCQFLQKVHRRLLSHRQTSLQPNQEQLWLLMVLQWAVCWYTCSSLRGAVHQNKIDNSELGLSAIWVLLQYMTAARGAWCVIW